MPSSWRCRPHAVPEPAMSLTLRHPEPVMPLTPCHLGARNIVVLPEPVTSLTPCHPWARDTVGPALPRVHNTVILPEPVPSPSLQCYICIFLYVILGLQILNLICYIATLFWYATLLWYFTHCYIAFILLHCFAMLYYCIALICYTLLKILLHYHIVLICYTLPHFFCSSKFLSIWIHTILFNGKSGLSKTSVATWANIVLLRFQLRTV
jgi:hypothetical protein